MSLTLTSWYSRVIFKPRDYDIEFEVKFDLDMIIPSLSPQGQLSLQGTFGVGTVVKVL